MVDLRVCDGSEIWRGLRRVSGRRVWSFGAAEGCEVEYAVAVSTECSVHVAARSVRERV